MSFCEFENLGEPSHPGGLRLTDRAARLAGVSCGQKLLDIGCGSGLSLAYLASKFGVTPHGIDISNKLIGFARQRLEDANFSVGDASSLPYAGGFFDVVFCECVLSVVKNPSSAICEMLRVLRSGGVLVVSDVCHKDDFPEIQDMFLNAGFVITNFNEHKAALITYAAEAYSAGSGSPCGVPSENPINPACRNSTYYLIICQRSD